MISEEKTIDIARDLVRHGWSVNDAARSVARRHPLAGVDAVAQVACIVMWLTWGGEPSSQGQAVGLHSTDGNVTFPVQE